MTCSTRMPTPKCWKTKTTEAGSCRHRSRPTWAAFLLVACDASHRFPAFGEAAGASLRSDFFCANLRLHHVAGVLSREKKKRLTVAVREVRQRTPPLMRMLSAGRGMIAVHCSGVLVSSCFIHNTVHCRRCMSMSLRVLAPSASRLRDCLRRCVRVPSREFFRGGLLTGKKSVIRFRPADLACQTECIRSTARREAKSGPPPRRPRRWNGPRFPR